MSDEFDDDTGADAWPAAAQPVADLHAAPLAPRLVARLYTGANQPLRARMLACLLRPLGPLGLVAIASGAFASFLARAMPTGVAVALGDAARYSSEQVFELARFAEQVNPDTLQQLAGLFNDNPVGMAAFSAAALTLLRRALQHSRGITAAPDHPETALEEAVSGNNRGRSVPRNR